MRLGLDLTTARFALTRQELLYAHAVGLHRFQSHPESRDQSVKGDPIAINQRGAAAELAFSLWSGIPWTGEYVHDRRKLWKHRVRDVGDFEVRSTCWRSGHLFIKDRDRHEAPFVLAIQRRPGDFLFAGWQVGRVGWQLAKRHDSIVQGDHFATAWVKQHWLRPMREIAERARGVAMRHSDRGPHPQILSGAAT